MYTRIFSLGDNATNLLVGYWGKPFNICTLAFKTEKMTKHALKGFLTQNIVRSAFGFGF